MPHFASHSPLFNSFRTTSHAAIILAMLLFLPALAAAQCTLSTTSPSVTICSPTNGSTVTLPFNVVAGTTDNAHPVTAMRLYIDNQSVYAVSANKLSYTVQSLSGGQHNITVNAWDSSGAVFKSTSIITVSSSGTGPVSVAINPTSATLAPGATQQFSATVLNTTNTAVTWSVDGFINGNTTVGTITNAGLYTAPSASGTHNVVATSVADTTKSDTAIVTVTTGGGGGGGGTCTPTAPAPSVTICSPSANSTVSSPVTVTAVDSSSTPISKTLVYIDNVLVYSTTATSVNTPLNVATGTHFLVVQFYNGTWIKKGENFTVSSGQTIGVAISPTTATVAPGANQQFSATVTGTTNTAVNWSVDGTPGGNSTVGTIDSTGLYTAPSTTGTHTVTATSQADSSKSASATVTVSSGGGGGGGTCTPNAPAPSVTICSPAANSTVTSPVTVTAVDSSTTAISKTLVYIDSALQYSTTASSVNVQLNVATGTHNLVVQFYNGTWIKQGENFTVSTSSGGGGGGGTPGTANVLTYHYDQYRRGANTGESTLTPSNVNSSTFGKKYSFPVDAQVYAQPLYMSNLAINGTTHNVVFVATENNTVYAYDSDSASNVPLWHVHMGTPITTSDTYGIKPWVGITGTPVIDAGSGTLYVVTTESGGTFHLHALSVTSGAEKFGGPVQVKATVPGTGKDSSGGQLSLSGSCYQRPGLGLYGNNVYVGFGHCGHGWLLNYNKSTLALQQAWNSTPDGAGGALWMGGGAPGFDDLGNLFFLTGVDFNDPAPGYPDSVMKMSPSLSVLDYFKPANEATLRANDADLGSGGGVVMPDNSSAHTYEYIGGGKDGRIFVLDRLHMGGYGTTDNVVQIVQTGTTQYDNLYDTPTYWNGRLYVHPANDVAHAFGWSNGMLTTSPTSSGSKVYGVHGATGAISSNGGSNGILWEIESTAYPSGGAAILHAYDATNLANELYNSTQAGSRDVAGPAVKFVVPTVADGKVFVGTGNSVDVYGLLP